MIEQKEKQTVLLEERAESFPFPCAVLGDDGTVLARNRLAKKLLPAASYLSRWLGRGERVLSGGTLFWDVLDEVGYFIGIMKKEWDGRTFFLACFLESFLPIQEPFAQYLLEEGAVLFGEAAECLEAPSKMRFSPAKQDALCAGIFRLRREALLYLRFVQSRRRVKEEPVPCSLEGFFRALEAASEKKRILFSGSCKGKTDVYVSPDSLSLIFLNVMQFISLFDGENCILATARQRGRSVEVLFRFEDRGGLFCLFETLLGEHGENGLFPGALALTPLFSALVICRTQGYRFRIFSHEKSGEIRLTLPSAQSIPEAFLSSAKEKEILILLERMKEMYLGE